MLIIAGRVVVLGEDRRVLADVTPDRILGDRDMLVRANLIHEHLHEHGGAQHSPLYPTDEHHHDGRSVPEAEFPEPGLPAAELPEAVEPVSRG